MGDHRRCSARWRRPPEPHPGAGMRALVSRCGLLPSIADGLLGGMMGTAMMAVVGGRRMAAGARKVTVSVTEELLAFADQAADRQGTSRSGLICELLAERRARERAALAHEGYAFYALEAEEFAAASAGAVAEAVGDERTAR